ncbi:hypothetical protein E2C01_040400 [Portunus trituberculatus]|uniref:Uncharacterized protein n=1 Tax=Portunus trituberculatus TaxID=210409 RepID=A0A5B7FMK2_PORTR|nr:hypothetical protein [Portunus trituberculatus]
MESLVISSPNYPFLLTNCPSPILPSCRHYHPHPPHLSINSWSSPHHLKLDTGFPTTHTNTSNLRPLLIRPRYITSLHLRHSVRWCVFLVLPQSASPQLAGLSHSRSLGRGEAGVTPVKIVLEVGRGLDGPPRHLQSKALRGNIFQAVSFPKDPQNKPSISPFTARPPAFSNARQEFAVRDKNPLLPRRFTGHQPRCSGRSITLCLSVGGARRRDHLTSPTAVSCGMRGSKGRQGKARRGKARARGKGRGRSAATGVLMQHNLDFSTPEAAETRVREPRTPQPQPPSVRDLSLGGLSCLPQYCR